MDGIINFPVLAGYLRYFLLIYLGAISLISVIVTVVDKINAKKHKRRVPESDLLLLGALGGSVLMYLTMLIIRHKTKHVKFMAGLPAIILLHAVLAVLILV
ncbi:MAG: DUF1294 domain-containing protein [Ruminococcaceae bacterium]|nr:DUF1294 domain-containing protein [Oscillospiraceae bacterium]